MPYRTMGWIHANVARLWQEQTVDRTARLRSQSGQGTVEYVGLMLLLAALLTAVVAVATGMKTDGGIAKGIIAKLKETIESVGAEQ